MPTTDIETEIETNQTCRPSGRQRWPQQSGTWDPGSPRSSHCQEKITFFIYGGLNKQAVRFDNIHKTNLKEHEEHSKYFTYRLGWLEDGDHPDGLLEEQIGGIHQQEIHVTKNEEVLRLIWQTT